MNDRHAREYAERGFTVLRALLSADEVEQLYQPIRAAYVSGDYEASAVYDSPEGSTTAQRYPVPGNHCLGSRIMGSAPHIMSVSADHPAIYSAVEKLLGSDAVLSQYQVYMRTPGSKGTAAGSKDRPGGGTHYDYKPWRPVGSFLEWLFVIIPLVDYTEQSGPLLAVPGSHLRTEVLPSDGRVHPVRCAVIPSESEAGRSLEDPCLRAGDVMIMHGFCWHEAWPNRSEHDRCGVYLKYHAACAPPACGPIVHPHAALSGCRASTAARLLPYTRADGRCAGIRFRADRGGDGTEPIPTVDHAACIVERPDTPEAAGRTVLAVRALEGQLVLPSVDVDERKEAAMLGCPGEPGYFGCQYLDCGNVIWSMQAHLQSAHGVHVPWLSWIDDQVSSCSSPPSPPSLPSPPSPATAQPPSPATAQTLRRVYAYRAPEGAEISARDAVWASPAELEADAAGWVRMWQTSTDGQGRVVKRGMGFAIREGNRLLAGTYNNAGVCEGETWLCAEFDAHGALRRPSRKVADAGS